MVYISEWLPNPNGSDAQGEWIEIHNPGAGAINLTGWKITADGKKFFTLQGTIPARARVVIPRSESKVTLKNIDGGLALYNAAGQLVDQASFLGSAPEGESANRADGMVFFTTPTPGQQGALPTVAEIEKTDYPIGVPLGPVSHTGAHLMGSMLGTAVALAAAIMFILKSHEELSHIFFGGDQEVGGAGG
jgi:hypothetical protein